MTDGSASLPPALHAKLMSFLRDTGGEIEVVDGQGLVDFVFEHREHYPVLGGMLKLNETALREHFERTGEVPPGVKLIRTATREGDNVTKLEIFNPTQPHEK